MGNRRQRELVGLSGKPAEGVRNSPPPCRGERAVPFETAAGRVVRLRSVPPARLDFPPTRGTGLRCTGCRPNRRQGTRSNRICRVGTVETKFWHRSKNNAGQGPGRTLRGSCRVRRSRDMLRYRSEIARHPTPDARERVSKGAGLHGDIDARGAPATPPFTRPSVQSPPRMWVPGEVDPAQLGEGSAVAGRRSAVALVAADEDRKVWLRAGAR